MRNITVLENPEAYNMYSYNSDGIRIGKVIDNVNEHTNVQYILDGNKIIRETRSGTNNYIINYYYDANDSVIGFEYNNNKYMYLKNLQNDIIGIVDENSNVVVKYYYDAYGMIINIVDTSNCNLSSINPFKYRSYYQDDETGWYYLNSRYYNPLVKRFITMDSVEYLGASGTALSMNLFSYCENNPVNNIDSDGYRKEIMSVKQTLIYGIIGLVVNLLKYGANIFRIFKKSSEEAIVKIIMSVIFILPISLSTEIVYYFVKNVASIVVSWSKSIFYEFLILGLDAGKLSLGGVLLTIGCTIALMYLPKLYDSINMIIYGLKNKRYYRDVKWYGIKYYNK